MWCPADHKTRPKREQDDGRKRGKKIVEIGPHSPTDVETRAKRWRRESNTWPVIGRQSAAWKASWRHRVEMMIIQSVNDAVAPASSIKCTDLAVTIRKDAATPVKRTLAKSCKFSPRHGVDLLRWASCCVSHQVNAELQQLMDVLSDEEKACRRPGAHRQRQAKAGDRLAAEEKAARRYSRPRHATAGTNNKQPPHTCCHLINFTPLIGRVWASFAHQSMATDDTRADTSSAASIGAIFVLKSPLMDAPALVSCSTHSKWRDVTRHVSACPANGENSCVVALLLFFCPSRTESLLLLLFHLLVILLLLPLRVVFFSFAWPFLLASNISQLQGKSFALCRHLFSAYTSALLSLFLLANFVSMWEKERHHTSPQTAKTSTNLWTWRIRTKP